MGMRTGSPRLFLQELIQGPVVAQAIYAVARLGVADLLRDGPRTDRELAEAARCHAPSLYRVLRLLTELGLFREGPAHLFEVTALGSYLRQDVPGSLRSMALAYGQSPFWPVWAAFLHSVQTGEPAFRTVFGLDIFDYYPRHQDEARLFNELMTDLTAGVAPTVADAYDFTGVSSVVDVGGGEGQMLAAILRAHPHLHGVILDLPHVVTGAPALLQAAGVAERCRVVGGDAFTAVPAGHDVYLLSRVIHDWDDQAAITLLTRCRQAMGSDAALLLVERVIPDEEPPLHMLQSDLIMLVAPGGRERTEEQYRRLLDAARFDLVQQRPALEPYAVLEARPRRLRASPGGPQHLTHA